jgi:hypothetical protein
MRFRSAGRELRSHHARAQRRIDARRVSYAREALALGNVLAAMICRQRDGIIDAPAIE